MFRAEGRLAGSQWWLEKDATVPASKFGGGGGRGGFDARFEEFRARFCGIGRLLRRRLFPPRPKNLFGLMRALSLRRDFQQRQAAVGSAGATAGGPR